MPTKHHSFLLQSETVFMIISGITALALDSSFISFSKDMDRLWKIALDPYKFPPLKQMRLKYFLSLLLIVKTFSIHITIALYVVMLWPAIFAERAYLLIPWIVIGTIRLCVDFLATITGIYICSKYGFLNTLWIEFLLTQFLQRGPFFYIWLTIMKYRSHLLNVEEERRKNMEQEIYRIQLNRKSRQKIFASRKYTLEDRRDTISYSTLTTIIQRISDRKKENLSTRSLDTLLEIIERGHHSEDLSSMDSSSKADSGLEASAMQELQLTSEDIEQAKKNKFNDVNQGSEVSSLIHDQLPTDQTSTRILKSMSIDTTDSENETEYK